mgnify:FL=1
MISIEYKKIYKIPEDASDFSLKDEFNKIGVGQIKHLTCEGFGNHLIGKDVFGNEVLLYIVSPAASYSSFLENISKSILYICPFSIAINGNSNQYLFDLGFNNKNKNE